jgi:hypothetical protein
MNRTSPFLKPLAFAFAVAAVAFSAPRESLASDHADGLKTAVDLGADITDLFAFTSPKDPNKMVLIMNVHALAFSQSRFSNAVEYKFRIRPIENAQTLKPSATKEETVVCTFAKGAFLVAPKQQATCVFNFAGGKETLTFETRSDKFTAGGVGELGDLRAFAGVRSDPWFLDLGRTVKLSNGELAERTPGKNGLKGSNILSIVVEFNKSRLASPLVAVAAQTVRK